MYVIKRVSDGKYVAKPGSHKSYTLRIDNTRLFSTKESAERDACENERIVYLFDIFKGR